MLVTLSVAISHVLGPRGPPGHLLRGGSHMTDIRSLLRVALLAYDLLNAYGGTREEGKRISPTHPLISMTYLGELGPGMCADRSSARRNNAPSHRGPQQICTHYHIKGRAPFISRITYLIYSFRDVRRTDGLDHILSCTRHDSRVRRSVSTLGRHRGAEHIDIDIVYRIPKRPWPRLESYQTGFLLLVHTGKPRK